MAQPSPVVAIPEATGERPQYTDITSWLGPLGHEVIHERQQCVTYFGGVRLRCADVFHYKGHGERQVRRHRDHIREDSNCDYVLCLPLSGKASVSQGSRDASVSSGGFILMSLAKPFDCTVSGEAQDLFSCLHVRVSAAALRERLSNADDYCGRASIAEPGAGQIMRTLLGHALTDISSLSVAHQVRFNGMLMDSIATAIEATNEAEATQIARRGMARGRIFDQACTFIRDNLCNPALDISLIADYCHVSSRYVQAAFASFSATVSGYILEQRLQQCRRALQADGEDRSITAVATDWGFNDLPYFSRAYRARFGRSPTEDRHSS